MQKSFVAKLVDLTDKSSNLAIYLPIKCADFEQKSSLLFNTKRTSIHQANSPIRSFSKHLYPPLNFFFFMNLNMKSRVIRTVKVDFSKHVLHFR